MVDHTMYPGCGTCASYKFDREIPSVTCEKHSVALPHGLGFTICRDYEERKSCREYIPLKVHNEVCEGVKKLKKNSLYSVAWVFQDDPFVAEEVGLIQDLGASDS